MQQAFYQSIRHYAEGNVEMALAAAQSIAEQGELYAQAARWLEKVVGGGETGAYLDAEAFGAFIRGGGNAAMYQALEKRVAAVWEEYRPATILDIGPGDGQVIIGALKHTRLRPLPAFDLVEPAANLLPRALERLSAHHPPVEARGFNITIQHFIEEASPEADWELGQATWSLQNLSPTQRAPVFRWLRGHCTRLLLVEFDVHTESYPWLSPERVGLIHDKYLAGVAEYTGHMEPALEERVKQAFLMPILFGYFRPGAGRSTHEGTIESWSAGLQGAGFRMIRCELLYPYWWADAYLLMAHNLSEKRPRYQVFAEKPGI